MTEVENLFNALKKLQEPKGYFFNKDRGKVFELLEGLLINRKRYGYMCCPCRLASGDRDADRDIICPCAYREEDVRQYGSCYCGLYVSEAGLDQEPACIPERRPPEKFVY